MRDCPGKFDLHETWRPLSQLSEYQHLHRFWTLCVAHGFRGIRASPVSDQVKSWMRSLFTMTHLDFDGTVQRIRDEGGPAGIGKPFRCISELASSF